MERRGRRKPLGEATAAEKSLEAMLFGGDPVLSVEDDDRQHHHPGEATHAAGVSRSSYGDDDMESDAEDFGIYIDVDPRSARQNQQADDNKHGQSTAEGDHQPFMPSKLL